MTDYAKLSDAELMAAYKRAKDPFESALAAESADPKVAEIARSIYQQESGSGKNAKTSNAGAVGGMQIIPGTFKSVADKDWDINDPTQNARAGIRYVKQLYEQAGGDPALTAAGYYGGPGGLEKARRGVAVSDPRNPNAPTTLQYGQQVAARIPKEKGLIQRGVEAVIPSAEAGTMPVKPAANPLEAMSDEELMAAYKKLQPAKPAAEPGIVDTLRGYGQAAQQATKDVGLGALRGAGSIGATLVAPYDIAKDAIDGKGLSLESNRQRRADMDGGLRELGADTESMAFQGGKLAGELAGTAGVGTAAAAPLKAMGVAPKLAAAIQSGGMTVGGAPASGLVQGAANLATRAAGGAISGGLSAGLVNPEDAKTGAMLGGALPVATKAAGLVGQGAGKVAGKVLAGGGMSDDVKALATRAQELGIDIPADRLVDSKPLNAVASSLNYVPFSGRAGTERKMQDQLNTALSRTFGQDSPNVTMALRKAQGDLGAKFDKVLKNNTVNIDPQFLTDLGDVSATATKELGQDGLRAINGQIDELMTKGSNGAIDGQAAYNIKRALDRIGQRQGPEAFHARELKKALMSALDRSIGPQEAAAFAEVRKQYGNMLSLENLAKNGVEGDISIARLANMKNIGNADLQELADISAQFLKPREGQHGSMQRIGMGIGGAIASGMGAAPAVGVGVGAGRLANAALNSSVARNALMGTPQTNSLIRFAGEPDLAQMFYRAAPVVGSQP